jgi:hypothetical protein
MPVPLYGRSFPQMIKADGTVRKTVARLITPH